MNRKLEIKAEEECIKIYVDGEVTLIISKGNKANVKGEEVYKSLNYRPGDHYELTGVKIEGGVANKNVEPAKLIYGLYQSITEEINKIK